MKYIIIFVFPARFVLSSVLGTIAKLYILLIQIAKLYITLKFL